MRIRFRPGFLALLTTAILIGYLSATAAGEEVETALGPLANSEVFELPLHLCERGRPNDAAVAEALLRKIAAERAGTGYEATARLYLVLVNGDPTQPQMVIDRFPGTVYWFIAREQQIELNAATSTPGQNRQRQDQLLTEVGAPTLTQVLNNQVDPAFSESSLAPQFRYYVYEFYYHYLVAQNAGMDDLTIQRVILFLRRSFPTRDRSIHSLTDRLSNQAEHGANGAPMPGAPRMPAAPETAPPIILVMNPPQGGTLEPSGEISVQVTDGDFWQTQVCPKDCKLIVDGQDVSADARYDSQFFLTVTDPNFEVMTLKYRLTSPAAGTHTASLTLSDFTGNKATTTWTFTVVSEPVTPLSLQLQVTSKHVKPHKGEIARILATATNPPTTFAFAIYRSLQSAPVYSVSSLPAPNGVRELTWDGLDIHGNKAANGNYTVVVTATDSTGRTVSQSAQVVVNFQGGHAYHFNSWLLAIRPQCLCGWLLDFSLPQVEISRVWLRNQSIWTMVTTKSPDMLGQLEQHRLEGY